MKYEYSLSVKLELFLPKDITPEQLDEKIKEEGKNKLRYYLSGYLFDPEKKIIEETIKTQ